MWPAAAFALAAGALFALQAAALGNAGTRSVTSVLLGATAGVVFIASATSVRKPPPHTEFIQSWRTAVPGGLAIFVGDLSYLYAPNRGPLTTVSVIAQLHPLCTALLASLLLAARMNRWQVLALVLAASGAALIGLA